MYLQVRNVDYKDPVEEEWERFQKEIQEENISSELILDEDQEAALRDKEIEWVDEQMQMWSWYVSEFFIKIFIYSVIT